MAWLYFVQVQGELRGRTVLPGTGSTLPGYRAREARERKIFAYTDSGQRDEILRSYILHTVFLTVYRTALTARVVEKCISYNYTIIATREANAHASSTVVPVALGAAEVVSFFGDGDDCFTVGSYTNTFPALIVLTSKR